MTLLGVSHGLKLDSRNGLAKQSFSPARSFPFSNSLSFELARPRALAISMRLLQGVDSLYENQSFPTLISLNRALPLGRELSATSEREVSLRRQRCADTRVVSSPAGGGTCGLTLAKNTNTCAESLGCCG